ncbi:MAG: ORF6N domain-containing protein [Polyangia bacterium]
MIPPGQCGSSVRTGRCLRCGVQSSLAFGRRRSCLRYKLATLKRCATERAGQTIGKVRHDGQSTTQVALISSDTLTGAILVIRGHKVMLDADLAALYGVETKALNRAVRRNIRRFLMTSCSAHQRRNGWFKVTNCDLKDQS